MALSGSQPTDLAAGERWFVVHTLPHQEKRAQIQLENQRYRTFLPKRQKTIRHARKLTTVVAPFFPRYMFIILDPGRDQWRPINGTLGVAGIVMQGERPHPAPPGIVETLVAATGPNGLLQLRPRLKVGDSVRLTQGPFAEYLGTLDRLDDSGRVRVLLDMLGRRVPILVEGHHVGHAVLPTRTRGTLKTRPHPGAVDEAPIPGGWCWGGPPPSLPP